MPHLSDPYENIRLIGLLLGGTVIFVVGLLDDIYQFRALSIFTGQSIAAGIAIAFQIFIEFFNNPITGQQTVPWAYIVTVTLSYFWLVGMMNTVNFLDGLDGLAGGVAFIAGTMLFVNSALRVTPPQTSVSLLMLALMGSSLGFVLYNFYPARIMMGGGAFYLGYPHRDIEHHRRGKDGGNSAGDGAAADGSIVASDQPFEARKKSI